MNNKIMITLHVKKMWQRWFTMHESPFLFWMKKEACHLAHKHVSLRRVFGFTEKCVTISIAIKSHHYKISQIFFHAFHSCFLAKSYPCVKSQRNMQRFIRQNRKKLWQSRGTSMCYGGAFPTAHSNNSFNGLCILYVFACFLLNYPAGKEFLVLCQSW